MTRKLRFVVNREHDGTGKKKILVLAEQLVHNAIEDSAAWAFSMILAGRRPWGRGTTPPQPPAVQGAGGPIGSATNFDALTPGSVDGTHVVKPAGEPESTQ
jgi:hypothetical protein